MELDEISPPVKDDRNQLEDRDSTCGLFCGSSNAVPVGIDEAEWDTVDGPVVHRVKKTIYWVSVMDGLQRVLIFADDENLSCLARKVLETGLESSSFSCNHETNTLAFKKWKRSLLELLKVRIKYVLLCRKFIAVALMISVLWLWSCYYGDFHVTGWCRFVTGQQQTWWSCIHNLVQVMFLLGVFIFNFSLSSFAICLHLHHPQPSLFIFCLF